MRPKGLFSVIFAAVILVFALAACQQAPANDVIDPTVELEEPPPADTDPGAVDPLPEEGEETAPEDTENTGDAEAETVAVTLTDDTIQMPATVAAGTVTFEVTNDGTMEHNFSIEGNGSESSLDAALAPGDTQTLEVDLEPGTYTAATSMADDDTQGMTLEFVVE